MGAFQLGEFPGHVVTSISPGDIMGRRASRKFPRQPSPPPSLFQHPFPRLASAFLSSRRTAWCITREHHPPRPPVGPRAPCMLRPAGTVTMHQIWPAWTSQRSPLGLCTSACVGRPRQHAGAWRGLGLESTVGEAPSQPCSAWCTEDRSLGLCEQGPVRTGSVRELPPREGGSRGSGDQAHLLGRDLAEPPGSW